MADQDRADALVGEAELDLLEGRSTRKVAIECTIGRSPVSARPPATPIISCSRMPTLMTRSGCAVAAGSNESAEMSASTRATRGSSSSSRVAVSMNRSRMLRSPSVRRWRRPRTAGPGCGAVNASSIASWSRPSTAAVAQPLTAKREAMPPGQPCVADALSTTTTCRLSQADGAGVRDRLVVAALVEFGVAEQHADTRPVSALGAQPERDADAEAEAVAERAAGDLHARQQRAVGWKPSGESKAPMPGQVAGSRKPFAASTA